MSPESNLEARSKLTSTLHELSSKQLVQVRAFVAFLISRPPPTSPTPPSPAEADPTLTDPKLDTAGPVIPDSGSFGPAVDSEKPSYASLAYLLRMLFVDLSMPDEQPALAAPLRYKWLSAVPLIPQQQSEWCWAATAQMILTYHGDSRLSGEPETVQLKLARSVDPGRRNHLSASQLNVGGWPPFDTWGFNSSVVANPNTLSKEQAQAEIDAGRPFAVSWRYPGRGGHMLVIAGYLWVGDALWLVALDPWPAGKTGGDRSLISYDHYAAGMAGTWRTYFHIERGPRAASLNPESPNNRGAAVPTLSPVADRSPGSSPSVASSPRSNVNPNHAGHGWEAFFEALSDGEQRQQAMGLAISLVRTLAQRELTVDQDLGLFSSDPGDPEQIHIFHAMPVLELPSTLDLDDDEAILSVFTRFHRAVIMIGGEHGHLTSATFRQTAAGGHWEVIRLGRSHLVQAFNRLNSLVTEGKTLRLDGQEIDTSKHLTHLPLVMLRMPDARQYLLLMEVVGAPRRQVPFLFFPVYDDPTVGLESAQPLTLKDLDRALAWAPRQSL